MQDAVCAALMIAGTFFMVVGGVGVIRFPDLYMRVSSSTKASTLGAGFILLSLAFHFNELGTTMRAVATITFLVVTGPVSAHLISRAAYGIGVRLWEGTIRDELRGRYNPDTNVVESVELESNEDERPQAP
ncbi:MAG: monovalent cation/H(+) antiporter subunit G [Candidatus Abyssobacteria bacterium SURF_17]|uniref:Monovalent cation/H(+) antiporter subunit G n=1 Tax=Candidatus Abyssobacteria bacterium SURF_17 TaxID=2093361 RepID=A0A419F7R7_9BACT|nr:MAG: monovalent cation/H(+) antiporter subunit G [Candidatus Abyssubacteria bacterium SURF_17]